MIYCACLWHIEDLTIRLNDTHENVNATEHAESKFSLDLSYQFAVNDWLAPASSLMRVNAPY